MHVASKVEFFVTVSLECFVNFNHVGGALPGRYVAVAVKLLGNRVSVAVPKTAIAFSYCGFMGLSRCVHCS
jgi:hypothetical protein